MPAEQFRDAKNVDARADIYATGATLYAMVCGKAPFIEHGNHMVKIMWAKFKDAYILPQEVDPSLPPKLSEVINKAMALTPEGRYQNAKEMIAALASIASSLV